MGCLVVLLVGGVSAGAVFIFGYKLWVMVLLGLLWLASLVYSAVAGHRGFGGHGNTDLQIVIAGMFITAAILLPRYSAQKPCNQAKIALRNFANAENEYFTQHKAYTTELPLLDLKQNPEVYIMVLRSNGQSFAAAASHQACVTNKDGMPEVFMWDSARGGLQR
jgi:hypothetical protein